MKRIIAFYLSAFICLAAEAQTKTLSMEDAMLGLKGTLAPEKLKQLRWVKGADEYAYVATRAGKEILVKTVVATKTSTDVVSRDELNKILFTKVVSEKLLKDNSLRAKELRKDQADTLSAFPAIEWENNSEFTFEAAKMLWRYNITKKTLSIETGRAYRNGAEHVDIAPVTRYAAYTIKNNLYVLDGINAGQVTADSNINIVNGQSVHREEFGITKGTFWSPKGNKLAFYRMNQTMVADYPIVDYTTQPAKVKNIKYPMAGGTSHEVTVGVFDTKTGKTIFIETPKPADQYFTNIAWSPDEEHVYIAVLNREQTHMRLNSYNAQTGKHENTLVDEKDDKYTEPLHPVLFVNSNPDKFIWQSRRDGYNHLYLYDVHANLIRQLTKGDWEVTDVVGFDPKGDKVFFMATEESPVTSNLYSVKLSGGKITRLTQGEGMHTVFMNDNATLFVDQFSNTTTPCETSLYTTEGKKQQVILNAESPLKDYQLGQVSIFKIKGDSAQTLYCRMFKPVNFDSTKKYPVIVYQYGGPHAQMIVNSWTAGARDYWFQYMAEHGYVVFTLDPRGSMNRGKSFEQATFRQLGNCEMQDQLAGVRYLKKRQYVDTTRMGLFGWSFGGFMTCSMMTRHPDVFKVAVAGGPVIDWSYYEVMYTERYMDTPEENPKGYTDANVLNYVGDLKGKLMLIHGTSDPVVVLQHSMMFLKAAVDKKKQVDFFAYPGHEHNVLGKDRVHLYTKVTDYFMQNL